MMMVGLESQEDHSLPQNWLIGNCWLTVRQTNMIAWITLLPEASKLDHHHYVTLISLSDIMMMVGLESQESLHRTDDPMTNIRFYARQFSRTLCIIERLNLMKELMILGLETDHHHDVTLISLSDIMMMVGLESQEDHSLPQNWSETVDSSETKQHDSLDSVT